MDTLERKLPIGIQTFENIRKGGFLYVDKTAILWQIINTLEMQEEMWTAKWSTV